MRYITALLHDLRWRARWAALLALLLLVISWLAFRPVESPIPAIEGMDKLQHLAAFAALAFAALLAQAPGRRGVLMAAAGLLLYGVFIEVVQSFLPTRSAELGDVLADAAGIAIGLACALLLRRHWRPAMQDF